MATVESLLIDKREVAAMLKISVRTLERLYEEGKFPRPLSVGRRRLWRRDTVIKFVESDMGAA